MYYPSLRQGIIDKLFLIIFYFVQINDQIDLSKVSAPHNKDSIYSSLPFNCFDIFELVKLHIFYCIILIINQLLF